MPGRWPAATQGFANCPLEKITAAIGITVNDLFERRNGDGHRDEIITNYGYVDEHGTLLYEAVRRPGKKFQLRRPDGRGGWIWNAQGVRRILYRLPEVLEAVAAGQVIYIVEGEKDAETLRRLGVVATTNATGAMKWFTIPDAATVLTGATVTIVADRDATGYAHSRQVAASLVGTATKIIVVESATGVPKSDVTDHLAAGLGLDKLVVVAGGPGLFDLTVEMWLDEADDDPRSDLNEDAAADDSDGQESSSWLTDISLTDADTEQPMPTILARSDLHGDGHLFYAAVINGIHGDSGTGQGWIALSAIKAELVAGHDVLYLDLEHTAGSIRGRLQLMRVDEATIDKHLIYRRPAEPLTDTDVTAVAAEVTARGITLVVLDSLGEAFGLEGINEDRDNEVGPWLRTKLRPLADAGAAVLMVGHATKAADNPLHPSGSKRKRAAIGGVSYLVTADVPLVKGEGGVLRLPCAKDRHGNYRRGQAVSRLLMNIFDGKTDIRFDVPPEARPDAVSPLDVFARAAVRICREAGQPLSTRAIVDGMIRMTGKATTKRDGIAHAVALGALYVENGPRGSRMHSYIQELDGSIDTLEDGPEDASP